MPARKIKVLIVDDSALVRKDLAALLSSAPEIEVVGTAVDAFVAREKILKLSPDVLTLDLCLPRMDGLSFLKLLTKHHPIPAIIFSGLVARGSDEAIEALEAGAFDVVQKPVGAISSSCAQDLILKIKQAFRHGPGAASLEAPDQKIEEPRKPASARLARAASAAPAPPRPPLAATSWHSRSVMLIGASTGGTEAIKNVLMGLPAEVPPICIVQHIPAKFSKSFADRLNSLCPFEVREAQDGDALRPGLCLVAPGDFHMELKRVGEGCRVRLHRGAEVHHQRPAVDVLFGSAVEAVGKYAVAALLTGMGSDGGRGMKQLREAGAHTIAQNEATCVVYGMPAAAVQIGGAVQVLALEAIPASLMRHLPSKSPQLVEA